MAVDVFVSYARANKERTELLVKELSGVDMFWWDRDLIAGQQFPEELYQKIVECRVFLLLVSQASVTSEWVQRELSIAIKHGRVIVPVLLDRTPLPATVANINAIDLSGWDGQAHYPALAQLIRDIKLHLTVSAPIVLARVQRSKAFDSHTSKPTTLKPLKNGKENFVKAKRRDEDKLPVAFWIFGLLFASPPLVAISMTLVILIDIALPILDLRGVLNDAPGWLRVILLFAGMFGFIMLAAIPFFESERPAWMDRLLALPLYIVAFALSFTCFIWLAPPNEMPKRLPTMFEAAFDRTNQSYYSEGACSIYGALTSDRKQYLVTGRFPSLLSLRHSDIAVSSSPLLPSVPQLHPSVISANRLPQCSRFDVPRSGLFQAAAYCESVSAREIERYEAEVKQGLEPEKPREILASRSEMKTYRKHSNFISPGRWKLEPQLDAECAQDDLAGTGLAISIRVPAIIKLPHPFAQADTDGVDYEAVRIALEQGDLTGARALLLTAAETSTEAMHLVGVIDALNEDSNVRRQGFIRVQRAADLGHIEAKANLGLFMMLGVGTYINPSEGSYMINAALSSGLDLETATWLWPASLRNYSLGSFQEMMHKLQTASDSGEAASMALLGVFLANGIGRPPCHPTCLEDAEKLARSLEEAGAAGWAVIVRSHLPDFQEYVAARADLNGMYGSYLKQAAALQFSGASTLRTQHNRASTLTNSRALPDNQQLIEDSPRRGVGRRN